ncbi:LuxR C-terminal-related transcriptional regulator [Leptolyngbya sp. 7M]|uniref:LuxR C-terminal-related transcriptional regulator n=1 Tax=Leptolyngbya sp. 7M TaxID=2812896 RepID=UPI001B8D842C|nr:LuxR C-terminal-related transcriptional regulator [Leptolyngbya sp. 7M]QYO65466.1 LuxR C-terminal-related transcriptional regulator [Leptolyngbya sp. 7M]
MRLREVKELVDGTAEPAFALDHNGQIAAWNKAAKQTFGFDSAEAIGQFCSDVLYGVDECGMECSHDCAIRHRAEKREPLKSYDIQLTTRQGKRWFNMIVTSVIGVKGEQIYTIHIARPADLQKRLEGIFKEFAAKELILGDSTGTGIVEVERTTTHQVDLTPREIEILRLISNGYTSAKVASELFISKTTVNNHVQHILKKLNASSRLEAVRRAERARLI